VTLTALHFPKK